MHVARKLLVPISISAMPWWDLPFFWPCEESLAGKLRGSSSWGIGRTVLTAHIILHHSGQSEARSIYGRRGGLSLSPCLSLTRISFCTVGGPQWWQLDRIKKLTKIKPVAATARDFLYQIIWSDKIQPNVGVTFWWQHVWKDIGKESLVFPCLLLEVVSPATAAFLYWC